MRCGKCCTDMVLPVMHLLFPTHYLDENGMDFYRAHGIDTMFAKNEMLEFDYKGIVYKISALGLIRPDIYLDAEGQEFYRENNLDDLLRKNGQIRLIHRCNHLAKDNSCSIYSLRPQICRDFDCAQRDDCTDVYPLEFRS